ncbi:MAG: BON domain-containing protein [Blastocatellia bacterium]
MANESIYCAGCGITMVSFMKVCPRCGAERKDASPLAINPATIVATAANVATMTAAVANPDIEHLPAQPATSVITTDALQQKSGYYDKAEFAPYRDVVLMSPNEEHRRFPLFTRNQLTLTAIGITLLLLALIVGWLLWRKQRQDVIQAANAAATNAPTAMTAMTAMSANLSPAPLPSPVAEADQALFESVKMALAAYNPMGFQRYSFEIKDGVVRLNGVAEHQPEKDGAENVTRLVVGVKSVINNLQVKPGALSEPIKLNLAEAKLLDDALRRQLQENQRPAAETQANPTSAQTVPTSAVPTPDAAREAERLRREQLAAKQREEEAAQRFAAEEKLKRETDAYEKRMEEMRRAEADRRARAEQARLESSVLRYGTVAWSGIVDGMEEIIISGSSASVRHLSGNIPREVRASFSTAIPRSPMEVKLIWQTGRGQISIVQQPSAANGYTTIIRIDDSQKGGEKRYEFTIRWSLL